MRDELARAGELPRAAWRGLTLVGAVVAAAGVVGLLRGRALLLRTYWIEQVPAFLALALPAAATLAVTGALLGMAALRRRSDWLALSLGAVTVPAVVILLRAETVAEPLFSWRPLAEAVVASVPSETEIVFESPQEYQLVGGLAYYTRRPITLLEPPGFVAPTYLADQVKAMFLPPDAFARRWRAGEPLAFVSDPQRRRDDPAGLVPPPFHVLGRFGDRWALTNVLPAAAR